MSARRLAAALVLAVSAAWLTSACQSSGDSASCPAGQQWAVVHGAWKCISGYNPETGTCPSGKAPVAFAPGKPVECGK